MADAATAQLARDVKAGDRGALARAITLVESTRADHQAEADRLIDLLVDATGGAIRLGISGPPGVGKSTFIEAFGLHAIGHNHKVAVLAIDPASAQGGGAILGDKTRMGELSRHDRAFIRPSSSAGGSGGTARRTREAILVCEAAGHDLVIIETVGVGQSEIAVRDMVDMFLLLLQPGGGDELQGIKRGIIEIADLMVVTKADGALEGPAGETRAAYQGALGLIRPRWPEWTARVLACSALTGQGLEAVWDSVAAYRETTEASGNFSKQRAAQAVAWLWAEITSRLEARLRAEPEIAAQLPGLEAQVAAGQLPPRRAADRLIALFAASTT